MERGGSPTIEQALAHEAFVRATARAVLGCDDRVDDVVQESLLVALRSGPRAPGALRAWLGTIGRRRAVDVRRRDATERRAAAAAPPRGAAPSPEEIAAREEVRRALVEALLALEAPYRDVLILRFYENLPPRDIGTRLGVPAETVRTQVRRGIDRLRERLDARRGDRRAWALPMIAVAGLTLSPAAATVSVGVIATAAAVVAAALGGVLWANRANDERPGLPPVPATAETAGLDAKPVSSAQVQPIPAGSSGIVGYVSSGGRPASARVELRRIRGFTAPGRGAEHALSSLHAQRAWLLDESPAGLGITTDARGRFVVDGLETGTYDVRAILADGTARFTWTDVDVPGALLPMRFDVTAGPRTVRGRVLDASGAPARGRLFASIEMMKDTWGGALPVVVGEDGAFEIRRVGRGALHLIGAFEGRAEVDHVTLAARGEALWTLEAVGERAPTRTLGRVDGRVLVASTGAPVPGVTVRGASLGTTGHVARRAEARTDERGRFSLAGLGAGEVTAYVLDGGWMSVGLVEARLGRFNPLALRTDDGGIATTELRVEPAARVTGRVTDGDGRAVPRVLVSLTRSDDGLDRRSEGLAIDEGIRVRVATDPAGRFELSAAVPGRRYVASMTGADVLEADTQPFTAPANVEIRTAPFALDDWVDVTVVDDASGRTLEGTHVAIVRVRDDGYGPVGIDGTTGADGIVTLGPLPNARLGVLVSHPDRRDSSDDPIPVERPRMRIEIATRPSISGFVVLPADRHAMFCKVEVERVGGGVVQLHRFPDFEESGEFHVGVPAPGRYRLTFTQAMSEPRLSRTVEADAGAKDLEVVLEAEESPANAPPPSKRWIFRIRDGDGNPVARSQLWTVRVGGWTSYGVDDGEVWVSYTGNVETQAVQVLDARDAEGRSLAVAGALLPPRAMGPQGGEIDVVLAPERPIDGVVVGPDGAPIAGALVSATPSADEFKGYSLRPVGSARTDVAGSFRIGGTGDAEYRLTVEAPQRLLPASVTARGGSRDVRIALAAAADVSIRVVDADGRPVAGAFVVVAPAGPEHVEHAVRVPQPEPTSARTGADGIARLLGFDASRSWGLEIRPPNDRFDILPLDASPWTVAGGDVVLERARTVTGRVVDLSGDPIEGASVAVEGSGWPSATDARGRFAIARVRAVPTKLTVSFGRMNVTVDRGVESEGGAIAIDRGVPLRVRVEDWPPLPDGRSAISLSYHERAPDGRRKVSSGGSTATASWSLVAVPADHSYVVIVGPWPDGRIAIGKDLRGGPAVHRLTIVQGGTITGRLVGLPPAGWSAVILMDGDVTLLQGRLDADGRFEFIGVPAGAYRLDAFGAGFRGSVDGVRAGAKDVEIVVSAAR